MEILKSVPDDEIIGVYPPTFKNNQGKLSRRDFLWAVAGAAAGAAVAGCRVQPPLSRHEAGCTPEEKELEVGDEVHWENFAAKYAESIPESGQIRVVVATSGSSSFGTWYINPGEKKLFPDNKTYIRHADDGSLCSNGEVVTPAPASP